MPRSDPVLLNRNIVLSSFLISSSWNSVFINWNIKKQRDSICCQRQLSRNPRWWKVVFFAPDPSFQNIWCNILIFPCSKIFVKAIGGLNIFEQQKPQPPLLRPHRLICFNQNVLAWMFSSGKFYSIKEGNGGKHGKKFLVYLLEMCRLN